MADEPRPYENAVHYLLKMSETEDELPPYRCLAPIDEKVLNFKTKRIMDFLETRLREKERLITELREAVRNLVLDDVPHQYQKRLLELLK